jgi:hypothetical protein
MAECAHLMADACSKRSCRVSDPTEPSLAGNQTSGNKFKNEYLSKFETELKNILGCEFGDYLG